MTKSDRIRALLAKGRSTREIADEIGCSVEYVRAVKQRTSPLWSAVKRPVDTGAKRRSALSRYHQKYGVDMGWTERQLAYQRASYHRKKASKQPDKRSAAYWQERLS